MGREGGRKGLRLGLGAAKMELRRGRSRPSSGAVERGGRSEGGGGGAGSGGGAGDLDRPEIGRAHV